MSPIHRSGAAVLLATVLFGFAPSPATAQGYIEVSRQRQDIDAEFDDSIVLSSSTVAINVPALQEADGLGFAFGGWGRKAGIAFTYVRTDPRATSVLGDTVAHHRAYGLEFGLTPWMGDGALAISPLFKFGLAYTTLGLPGQGVEGTEVFDAHFKGIGVVVGAGGMLYLTSALHVTLDYTRRYLSFNSVSGWGESLPIADGLSGTGDVISLGVGVYPPW